MNECFHYLLFFLSLQSIVSINLFNVTIQHLCENDLLHLQCPVENETIQIIRSMYGRTSQRLCNANLSNTLTYKTCANIEQSTSLLKHRCHGQSSCQIRVNNDIFTDPCGPTIGKHFEIHFRCVDTTQFCSPLIFNCWKNKDRSCVENVRVNFSCQCPRTHCQYDEENQLISLIEHQCSEEILHGIRWSTTLVNKGQHVSCPYPCTGQLFRFCQWNEQWSTVNYSECQCPMKSEMTPFSRDYFAEKFRFHCQSPLIRQLFLNGNDSCLKTFVDRFDIFNDSFSCLIDAFERMSWSACPTLRIEFENLSIKIGRFELMNFHRPSTLMLIDQRQSLLLMEQSSNEMSNITVLFHHQTGLFRYQCRAYRSLTTETFFTCQLRCSNGSHVICQCPFFAPLMRYVLHLDGNGSMSNEELQLDNELQNQCSTNRTFDQSIEQIERLLQRFSSKKSLSKKILNFIDQLIEGKDWQKIHRLIPSLDLLGYQLMEKVDPFIFIHRHLEFFVNVPQMENSDRSIRFLSEQASRSSFVVLSNFNINASINSPIVHWTMKDSIPHQRVSVGYRHLTPLNLSHQHSMCVWWKSSIEQWQMDGCELIDSNSTHSICSCEHVATSAVLLITKKINRSDQLFGLAVKTISSVSIVFLFITIITLISIRRCINVDDDLLLIRNILHTNLAICFFVTQCFYLLGLDSIFSAVFCRIISMVLFYFLLASFSWMFVDGVELIINMNYALKIDRIRLWAYAFYAYGFPLLILILSLLLSTDGYHPNQHCWLSHNYGFLWSFAIPFVLLLLANVAFILFFIYVNCKNVSTDNQTRVSLRNLSIFALCSGIFWLFGLFFFSEHHLIHFSSIVTLLNSCQGLFIWLFYCLLQNHVQNFYLHLCVSTRVKSPEEKMPSTHYNTSSSGYSSAHLSDSNKQILTVDFHRSTGEYLPSYSHHLSTFRYPTTKISLPMPIEHQQQLLRRSHLDEHQYYEIG